MARLHNSIRCPSVGRQPTIIFGIVIVNIAAGHTDMTLPVVTWGHPQGHTITTAWAIVHDSALLPRLGQTVVSTTEK